MSEIKRYPLSILKLQSFEGFNAQFEKLLPHMRASQAYKMTEDIHYEWFQRFKYSSYDSFRVIRNKAIVEKTR